MKTNSLLTYLLYALLAALISIACYKACQMKKEKAVKAQEEAELQKTLRDMGYDTDTLGNSSYVAGPDTTSRYSSAKPDANGIVDAPSSTTKPTTTTKPVTTTKSVTTQPAPSSSSSTTVKPASTGTGAGLTAKSGVSKVQGPGTGKYSVRAGTFSSQDRAREQLEKVIKLGYQTASMVASPTTKGYWTVLILRTNDKSKADNMVNQLVSKGVDAARF